MSFISLGSNIASLTARRRLAEVSSEVGSIYEKLSSGLRINRPSDDAAGLSVSTLLNNDRRVFTQGIRNLSDGMSLLNIADGALEQLGTITTRLKELAEQAANGTYGVSQRKAIDAEAQALSKEYFRIERSTSFNDKGLFFAEFGKLRLQGGYGIDGSIESGLGGAIGTGALEGLTSYSAETTLSIGIALGDLNGDGILDMVTAGYAPGTDGYATVRLGRGDGSFGSATSFATEASVSTSVKLGDLNGDGILDLVTAGRDDANDGWATIRLGTGTGSFGAATSIRTEGSISRSLELGDVNGDGILDLVTAGQDDPFNGIATIRLGVGDGTFATATSFATETLGSYGVSLGDLNGDGILDLVTAGRGAGLSGVATVRLGLGNGNFGNATSYAAETNTSRAVTLGDLNGDGILDLVTAGYASGVAGYASVRLGVGDGTFGARTSFVTEVDTSMAVKLGDLNGDGFLDLITAGSTFGGIGDGTITIRLGNGTGTFQAATSYLSESSYSRSLALGDLNGDGVYDIATSGYGAFAGSSSVRLSSTVDGVAPLLPFKLTSRADALQALSLFSQKINQISTQRGIIGAFQSRLAVATSTLQSSSDNFGAAASRITDVDVAESSANLVRLQILQQASASVLAQANQQPALALVLLGT